LAAPASVLGDGVYRALFEAIVSGELAPGETVREVELAGRLGVSRTPVREALRRLAEVDLVRIEANRGSRVTDMNPAHLSDVADVLSELMGMCARIALPHLSSDDHVVIESTLQDVAQRGYAYDPRHPIFAGVVFDLVLQRADNAVLISIIGSLRPQLTRAYRLYGHSIPGADLADFAVDVIAAFQSLDAESLALAMTNYVRRPLKILIDSVDSALSTAGHDRFRVQAD